MSHNAILATTYIDVADMDVLEVRQIFLLDGSRWHLGTYMVVEVGGLEGDGVARDVGHVDVVDEDVLRSATSFGCTLEAQACICTLEGIVAYHDVLHTARELASNHKTAMGMVNGIVLDVDVLARTSRNTCCSSAAFHADAIVASIHDVVDNQYVLATRDVDSISILCIPRAFHSDAVNDDVLPVYKRGR